MIPAHILSAPFSSVIGKDTNLDVSKQDDLEGSETVTCIGEDYRPTF